MKIYAILLVISIYFLKKSAQDQRCENYGQDSVACVCDESHCENVDPRLPEDEEYLLVTSNKEGFRFETSYGSILQNNRKISYHCIDIFKDNAVFLKTNRTKTAQEIVGFGGAMTDAAGENLKTVSRNLQNHILEAYFSSYGLKYNMAKTTIGYCDFSPREYYYNYYDYDIEMKNWTLAEEDLKNKIPFLQRAQEMVGEDFRLISSMWTVPHWMKENTFVDLKMQIIKEYYDSYCLYIIKFLEAYREHGIEFWGLSFANEPFINSYAPLMEGTEPFFSLWTLKRYADFIINHFVPALSQDFSHLKVLFYEENIFAVLPTYTNYVKRYTDLSKYMEVVGLHSHLNEYISSDVVDAFHNSFPNVTILTTEYAAGVPNSSLLGLWSVAEFYAKTILQDMNHFYGGWVDWNMVLDTLGGPMLGGPPYGYHIDAPIILDPAKKIFYKQPSYYAIGHFSKFMPRGSVMIELKPTYATELHHAACLRPDGRVVVVLFNQTNKTISTTIDDTVKGNIHLTLSPDSINTLIF